ncbi:MAG TPA: hypothetical protein VEA59_02180 [Patescibacteria group bacterium]|nr:hypothetical protein [Patescibacteria group bacterium]
MKEKQQIIIIILAIIGVGLGSFFGGMKYGQSRGDGRFFMQGMQNMTPQQRQQMFQARGGQMFGMGNGAGEQGRRGGTVGLTGGEVISKDATSITIKLMDGGSKIVFFGSSTTVGKATMGTLSDITVGSNVMVNGQPNSDGSVTALSIQLRQAQ